MSTINIKRLMLKEAKRIANKEYKEIVETEKQNELIITKYISPEIQKEWDIDNTIKKYEENEEFDEHEFRKMIKDFEIRLHDGEIEEE